MIHPVVGCVHEVSQGHTSNVGDDSAHVRQPVSFDWRAVVAAADHWKCLQNWVEGLFKLVIVLCIQEEDIENDFPEMRVKGLHEGVGVYGIAGHDEFFVVLYL